MKDKYFLSFLKDISKEMNEKQPQLKERIESITEKTAPEEIAKYLGASDKMDSSVPGKHNDIVANSTKRDEKPAKPDDIEKQRWNDPLVPLDQKFVTLDQLNNHYSLFLKRIQQQMSTMSGGGEVRLAYLDDVDASNKINGGKLVFDETTNKFIIEENSYGRFSRNTNVAITTIDTPVIMAFDEFNTVGNIRIENGSEIFVDSTAVYDVSISAQLNIVEGGPFTSGVFYTWLRKNGVDIPRTTRAQGVVAANPISAIGYTIPLTLEEGDYIELLYAANSTEIILDATSTLAFAPTKTAAMLSITKI